MFWTEIIFAITFVTFASAFFYLLKKQKSLKETISYQKAEIVCLKEIEQKYRTAKEESPDLELATTEQVLKELSRRDKRFLMLMPKPYGRSRLEVETVACKLSPRQAIHTLEIALKGLRETQNIEESDIHNIDDWYKASDSD